MTDGQTDESQTADVELPQTPRRQRWYRRPTVRKLKKRFEGEGGELDAPWDERENRETRLPTTESVHFGGLVLTEAFTPSTISSLYQTLKRWPTDNPGRRQEWLEMLAKSRGGLHGGWQSLGVVRPPGSFVVGPGHHDEQLPPGVDAVWLHVSYVTPALAMVVATFTFTEDSGDLSERLRQDYRTKHGDTWVSVEGRFGDLRARIPWSRPARYRVGHEVSHPEDQKRKACLELIRKCEDACGRWFFARFRGRFAVAAPEDRPVIRMLFTANEVPYAERRAWLRPIGLDFARPLWRSTGREGWWLSEDRWPSRDGVRHVMTVAVRRSDAAKDPTANDSDASNWTLTQRFGRRHAPLAARHATTALLAIYAERLGDLRDKAGIRRFPPRPVREARDLENYLIRDGLDAATITSDLELFTRNLTRFRWNVPEFTEYLDHGPDGSRDPREYVPSLCTAIREQATRLASDTTTTTGNIRASAELRQAIAHTTLQRLVVALSVAATMIAVVSLLVATR